MRTKGLETTLKMTYDFIDIPPHDANEHVSGDQIPYYINGDFTPLDKYYQPINGDVYALNNSNDFQDVFTKDIFPSTFKPQDKILVSFPNPKEYQNKEDFKQAFELWYKEASIYFSYVTLPIPISGEFYLPEPPKIFTKEEKAHPGRFRTFKPELWQLLPRNYLLMLTKLYQKDEIDPEELFPEQVPKRDPLCFKHHLTSQDQWCSSLVASEPNPILYDFYEEYEEAYVKWCNVTYDTLRSCPIPPKGMQTVATLDPIKDEEADIFEPSNPVLDTAFLSWANEIPPVTNLTNISEKIQNLNSLVRSKSKEFSTHGLRCSHVLYVFGIDKSKFISDSIAYGLYEPVTKSQTTIKPNVCVLGIPEKNIDKVQNLITTNQLDYTNINCIFKILNFNLNTAQYTQILNLDVNGKKFVSLIDPIIGKRENIIRLLQLSNRSLLDKLHVGNFLNSYITTTESVDLINVIILPENLRSFHQLTSLVNYISPYRVEMLPSIKDNDEKLNLINRFYLLDNFLSLFRENNGKKFYTIAYSQCHSISSKISTIIFDQTFLRELRTSKKGTDLYRSFLMLLHSNSTRIHRILLGSEFLTWISQENDSSKLWSISHCSCMNQAAFLFAKSITKIGEILPNLLQNNNNNIYNIPYAIAQILNHIINTSNTLYFQFQCNELCDLLNDVIHKTNTLENNNRYLSLLLIPICKILINDRLIIDFKLNLEKLSSSVGFLVSNLHEIPNNLYKERIKAINVFLTLETTRKVIVEKPEFSDAIAKHLIDSDFLILHNTWILLNFFVDKPKSLYKMLCNKSLSETLSNIIKNNDNLIRRIFEFTAKILKQNDKDLNNKIIEILKQSMGRIVTIFKTSHTLFRNDLFLKETFEFCLVWLFKNKSQESIEFTKAFKKHSEMRLHDIKKRLNVGKEEKDEK